ncbi:MAG: hypothetical protein IJ087_11795 [Eggerthellaceae bacterium]|nr:hypothetical protein [Eggerthellaceae bacterium]
MFGKRIVALVTSIALAVSLCPGAAFASELQAGSATGQVAQAVSAQTAKNLKQRGVKFDLVNGKTYTVKSYLGGYGNYAYSAKLSGLKVTSADPGYKKATFTVTFKPKETLTEAQRQKVLKAFKKAYYYQGGASGNEREVVWSYWMRGALSYWLVDYKTGKLIVGSDNAAGIKRKTKLSHGDVKTYATSDGKWSMNQFEYIRMKETVTFPEDYENLCVGIGGETQPRIMRTKYDENFEGRYFKYVAGKAHTARWWQTSYFKKANDNFHFMRIR